MNNDEKIMQLKAQIDSKRKELSKLPSTFVPITNCLLELDGETYNLHVNSSDLLLLKLNMYNMSAQNLNLNLDDVIISGFKIPEWIEDVRNFLALKKYKAEKKKLDALEKKLDTLLSNDKRTELEIDKIAQEL